MSQDQTAAESFSEKCCDLLPCFTDRLPVVCLIFWLLLALQMMARSLYAEEQWLRHIPIA